MKKHFLQYLQIVLVTIAFSFPNNLKANDEDSVIAAENLFSVMFPPLKIEGKIKEIRETYFSNVDDIPKEKKDQWIESIEQAMKEETNGIKDFYIEFFTQNFTSEEIGNLTDFFAVSQRPGIEKFYGLQKSFYKDFDRSVKEMEMRLKKKAKALIKQK